MDGAYRRSSQRWPWPLWARYMYAFDRGLNTVLGGESRGGTHEELFWSVLGRLTLSLSLHQAVYPGRATVALTLTLTLTLTRSVLGQLMGVAWLAYFTSEMVQLVTNMNQRDELARSKISRVEVFAHHARLPSELNLRVKKHLEHVLLAKKIDLDTNELLAELSAPLRGEVGLHCCHPVCILADTPFICTTYCTSPLYRWRCTVATPSCSIPSSSTSSASMRTATPTSNSSMACSSSSW